MTRKFTGTELVIATHNQGKMAEFRALFAGAPLPQPRRGGGGMGSGPQAPQLHLRPPNMPAAQDTSRLFAPKTWGERLRFLSCADFKLPPPDETGATFLENATLKALFVAQATERPALADDSGLAVAALRGAPGVHSADWAETEGGRDFDFGMRRIHQAMGGHPDKSAAFVSCLALAWPDGHVESVEGSVTGKIVWPPRGRHGFGYDPMFMPDGFGKTYAELDEETKNSVSHRARAFALMMAKCFN